jgi:hypothetical protein
MSENRPDTLTRKEFMEFFDKHAATSGSLDFITFIEKGDELFTCTGTSKNTSIKLTGNNQVIENVSTAGMISGLIHQQAALTHGEITDIELDESFTTYDAQGFTQHFQRMTEKRILVPDTNTIINRCISSLKFSFLTHIPLSIRIPRFVLLEIERAANKAKSNRKRDRRNFIVSSVAELDYLRKLGATYLPELNNEKFEAFSRIAKDQKSDSWIRREIHNEIRSQNVLSPTEKRIVTLITSDLINALAAIAEGIDTIFLSLIDYDIRSTRASNIEQVALFTFMNAILFKKIRLKFDNNIRFIIQGNWQGKTSLHWRSDSVRLIRY